ncbi:hypothetical protein DPPLL_19740 [Desulfofustis limnaeus]|uniref:Glycosyltransferase n=2 Tax=Desulfofustis limnaeus TaxID=2740163 RepID=A0ABN6M6C8_9BACT|nr:hypothetical protein DPPLL_19740 [Desulfofustis limnaeus]
MKHRNGNVLLVANYESDVGYAWWLMENFWIQFSIIAFNHNMETYLIYPKINKLPKHIHESNINCSELTFPTYRSHSWNDFERFIKKNSIEIVYLSDRPYISNVYNKLHKIGVKYIINHDHSPGTKTTKSQIIKFFRQNIYRNKQSHCDCYIAVSNYVYNKLINIVGLDPKICHVIVNGIYPVTRSKSVRKKIRDELNFTSDDIVVVTTGRACYYKGIDFLIEFAGLTRSKMPNIEFKFIHCGGGPDLDDFRKRIQNNNMHNYFRCLGHCSNVGDILQGADLAIHASPAEACSLAILEYMSAGLPVLAPPVGGNLEQIIDGKTGLFYKYRDIDDLYNKFCVLVSDRQLMEKMGNQASMHVASHFNLSTMNSKFCELIKSVIFS